MNFDVKMYYVAAKENELEQCVKDLEVLVESKLKALQEIKADLTACIPNDGSVPLNVS